MKRGGAAMCGVVEAVGAIDEDLRAAVERASDALVHRGPDASGRPKSSLRNVMSAGQLGKLTVEEP
jgi:asparagine synthetase B (glutamine-hydrolysing)